PIDVCRSIKATEASINKRIIIGISFIFILLALKLIEDATIKIKRRLIMKIKYFITTSII
ncbi:hypothetical protein NAG84_16450, partial [Proteus terrae]|uniref:hypothetical protein n=1 Tax=Proteus terrae TaxID=1574161 RepID=UPI0020956CBC